VRWLTGEKDPLKKKKRTAPGLAKKSVTEVSHLNSKGIRTYFECQHDEKKLSQTKTEKEGRGIVSRSPVTSGGGEGISSLLPWVHRGDVGLGTLR